MARIGLSDLFARALRRLATATKAYWQRTASVDEINRLGTQETVCLARDLGISVDDIRTLAAKDRNAADLLFRRMEQLGLDPARTDMKVMLDLQRGCSRCIDKGFCLHELEDKPRDAAWPHYCPNEQTLAALTEEQPMRGESPGTPPTIDAPGKPSGRPLAS